MMTLLEKATILHYHRHRISTYSRGTVEALGWLGENSQVLRFEALASVGDVSCSSVLDAGCGHGDLKGYLDRHFHGFSYVGIDQMAEFIMEARALYGQRPNCYFCIADFTDAELPRADYVFASGALSYRCTEEGFHLAMIGKMYEAAEKALAFNMLDAAKFSAHELLTGHDAEKVLEYCKTLSPDVRLVRGYLEDDFTVLMYKES